MRRTLTILTLTACALAPLLAGAQAVSAVSDEARARAYLRSDAVFAKARLWKPTGQPEDSLAHRLAPLILTEGGARHPFTARVLFGDRDVTLGERRHRAVEYHWRHGDVSQGIRIVLDEHGFPLVWQVLHDSNGLSPVFVSAGLEQRAADALGGPLPGRLWSVEPALASAPATVVPRTAQPGPVPMGPFVYVQRGTHDVSTVICRCQPSQVEEIGESRDYTLVKAPRLPHPGPALKLRLP